MIVPEQITNFNRSQAELEEFALFSILVAGKSAKVAINQAKRQQNQTQKFGKNTQGP